MTLKLNQYKEEIDALVSNLQIVDCYACAGSGYYDHNGSPKCSGCYGTGKSEDTGCDNIQKINDLLDKWYKQIDEEWFLTEENDEDDRLMSERLEEIRSKIREVNANLSSLNIGNKVYSFYVET